MFVGLTGGTGCGKTSALECFSSLGWKILDADSICHKLYGHARSGVPDAIMGRWGKKVFRKDGSVDRKKIADIVFADGMELRWLNSLLHPKVMEYAKGESKKSRKPVIFAVPLLFEADWQDEFDCTVAIWAEGGIQRERLRKRGWSTEEIDRRCRCQISPEKKMELADYAIINNGTPDSLYEQCKTLNKQLRKNYGKR